MCGVTVRTLWAFLRRDTGATAIEYTLICAFIALAITTVLLGLGTQLKGLYQSVVDGFSH